MAAAIGGPGASLHLAIDPDTGEVLASALTTTEEGDASLVRPLLDQIAAPIAAVLADGAYDGDPVYRAVVRRDNQDENPYCRM